MSLEMAPIDTSDERKVTMSLFCIISKTKWSTGHTPHAFDIPVRISP